MTGATSEERRSGRRVSRRAFVLGGAGLAVVGGGGVYAATQLPLRSWWMRHTGACGSPGPIPPKSQAVLKVGSFDSTLVGGSVGYSLAAPPGHDFASGLPVTIMLPGRGGRGDGTMTATHMADLVAQGIAERGVAPFGLAAIDGGTSYWHPRASGEDRMGMLTTEFLPMIAQRFGLGADKKRLAIMGWSMGGYGALLMTERYPDVFCAVSATSPAIWQSYQEMVDAVGDAFDNAAQFAEFDVIGHAEALAGKPVRIDCGFSDPFYPNVKAFVAALPAEPQGEFRPGCHTADTWRWFGPGQVDFLGSALSVRSP
jgi:pimeloyl-ACP methyl ester carboxylesterase